MEVWKLTLFVLKLCEKNSSVKLMFKIFVVAFQAKNVSGPLRNRPWANTCSKGFLVGFFSGELFFGGAYYWREFCVLKWAGLDNKKGLKHKDNSLKQIETANSTIHGLIIRRACYQKDICI